MLKVLSAFEENDEMLKQLGYSKSEIKCRGLIPDHIEEYIIKQGKLTLDSSNMQQSIALIMVKSLFSPMSMFLM